MTLFCLNRRHFLMSAGAGVMLPAFGVKAATAFTSSRITVDVTGQGRDVLLIPGLGSGPSVWNGLVAGLSGFRWHRVHVGGFAGMAAGANAEGAVVQPVADEIARYIKSTGLRNVAIIGHSMGGTISMLLGSKGIGSQIMVVDMLPAGAAMVGGTAGGFGYLANQLSGYFTGTKAGRAYLAQIVAQTPGAQGSDPTVIANSLRDLANLDVTALLPGLKMPMQVVYAVGSDREQAAAMTHRFRAAYSANKAITLIPIGPSGHVIMADQPAKFKETVVAFIR